MNRKNRILSIVLSVLMLITMCVNVFAAGGSVSYDGIAKEFVFSPGSEKSPTDLFSDFKNIMPGDSITQQIEIKNSAGKNTKIKLYLRSTGANEGSEEFLSQLTLTVKQQGSSELFKAPASQTAGLTDWVYLGTVFSGGEVILDVTLEAPITMDNSFQNKVGYLNWQFMSEELPVESGDPKPPDTDDTELFYLWLCLCGVCFVGIIILFVIRPKIKKYR